MRRLFFLIAAFCIVSPLHAQDIGDYLSLYDYGFGLDWMSTVVPTLNYEDTEDGMPTVDAKKQSVMTYGAWVGFNFPLVQIDNNLSAGISPNATLFITVPSSSQESEYSYFGDRAMGYTIPVIATLKYGTDAQYKGRMKFGATLGVGYRYTSYITTSNESMPAAFGVPILMGELNVKMGRKLGLLKIRYLTSLVKGRDKYDLELSQSSLYLVYTPNW